MGEIFINYRRDDTAGEARALFNELREKVGADAVFMDVDNIALGRDFREVLTERLATVDVMLALIGTEWTQAKDKAGRRRLDDPNDFVRREIRAALQRNIAVTPVLLKDATMPAEADLPEDIRALAFRNAFELTHSRWSSDVSELIHRLGLIPLAAPAAAPATAPAAPRPAPAAATPTPISIPMPTPTPMPAATSRSQSTLGPIAAVVAVLIASAGGYWYYQGEQAKEAALKQAQAEAEQARQAAEAKLVEARAQAASQAERQARLEQERIAAQKEAAAAKQLADARLAESQRAAAARQEADAQRAADARQRAEAQRIADARQAADQAARDKATVAALAAAKDAQATGTKPASTPSEADTQARVMADVKAGKWVGSVSIGLGDYALWKSLSWTQLDGGAAIAPCTVWSRTFNNDDRARFLVSCLGASAYFNRTGMPVGRRAAQNYWNVYCGQLATTMKLVGDDRDRLIAVCSRFR